MRLAIVGSTVQRILPMGLFHVLSVFLTHDTLVPWGL